MNRDYSKLVTTFREMIRRNNWVVLDTETTGLKWPAEIVNITVVDWTGQTLIDSLIRPVKHIPADATAIHGITDADVAHAPLWRDVRPQVLSALNGRDLIIYNAGFDLQLLEQTDDLQGIKEPSLWRSDGAYCAMLFYAELRGEDDQYRQGFRWQKLTSAMGQMGLDVRGAHGALGDCTMTRELILASIAELARQEVLAQVTEQPDQELDPARSGDGWTVEDTSDR